MTANMRWSLVTPTHAAQEWIGASARVHGASIAILPCHPALTSSRRFASPKVDLRAHVEIIPSGKMAAKLGGTSGPTSNSRVRGAKRPDLWTVPSRSGESRRPKRRRMP